MIMQNELCNLHNPFCIIASNQLLDRLVASCFEELFYPHTIDGIFLAIGKEDVDMSFTENFAGNGEVVFFSIASDGF